MALSKRLGLRVYNGKLLWETFMGFGRAGSYGKLRAWAQDNGQFNPNTGRVSRMGVFWAMWRYAFENPEEAYPLYKEWQMEFGLFPTFKEFCFDVYTHVTNNTSIVTNRLRRENFKSKYLV